MILVTPTAQIRGIKTTNDKRFGENNVKNTDLTIVRFGIWIWLFTCGCMNVL